MEVSYAQNHALLRSQYIVTFVNEKGVRISRGFDSRQEADRFWNKLKYSRRAVPVAFLKR